MTDPVRILLDRARPAYEPTPQDQERVRQALLAGLAPLPQPDPTAAAAPVAGSAIAAKVVAASLVVGAATFGAGFVTGRSTAPAPSPAVAPSAAVVSTPSAIPLAVAPEVLPEPPVPSARPARALPSAPGPHPSAGSTLWEEATLLREAQRALREGDPGASLSMLDRMAEKYPSGALEEERMAARVLALCGSGRSEEARRLAAQFLSRYPGSVHAARVRAACAASGL